MSTITLYDYVLSGNCYKVRLLASLLNLEIQRIDVDFHPGREHRMPAFRKLNPLGELPVLRDGNLTIRDAQAILVHLASTRDDSKRWYPLALAGEIQQWLSFADLITRTASAARLHDMLGFKLDVQRARHDAHRAFRVLDDHLHEREILNTQWLVGEHATIADIACFPYVALAEDGGISLDNYGAIRHWLMAVKRLNGFVAMPGISPAF